MGAQAAPPEARSLLDIFGAAVAASPRRVAIEAGAQTVAYEELAAAAMELAGRLGSLGIGPGDRVGVRVTSGSADLYVAILGVLTSGAAYVPVDADESEVRAEAVWRLSGACAVVSDGLAVRVVARGAGAGRAESVDDDAWVIFTSGSTGEPKGVAVTHRSAAAFVDAENELWSVSAEDRVLAGLSVGFDASCEEMWLAWRNGAALVPAPRSLVRSGAEFGPWLAEQAVTVVSTVPTLAALWDVRSLAGVRLLILGGEVCPAVLGWRLAEGREVWNTYGPTEATVVTTAARVRPGMPVTIGWPLRGWRVAVVDEDDRLVEYGEAGELVIGGVGLGRYLDRELDARRFRPLEALGWERAYRTGDLARDTVEGVEFLGRRDRQVKIGGRRVELGEIEARLAEAPGVRTAAVVVRQTGAGNRVPVGYIAGSTDAEAVRSHIGRWLPDGVAPVLVVLDELPLRSSGKVDQDALPWPPPSRSAHPSTALTGTAAWLAECWSDQLGEHGLDADSDFFELGGTSLAVAQLVSRLRARFPGAAVADVYQHRRLGELAARLDWIGERSEESHAVGGSASRQRSWVVAQLTALLWLFVLIAPGWLIGILAYNDWQGRGVGPQLGWLWLGVGWLVFVTPPGRASIVVVARWALLGRLQPGRYSRHGWLALRLWLVERLTQLWHLERLAGTPWAARYARLCGARVGAGVHLGTLPPPTGLISIGDGATVEPEVDLRCWWIEAGELVIGELEIGPDTRVGARSVLMPGARIGAGAEVEPGSVVSTSVPGGERWNGSPAAHDGAAGESWPSASPSPPTRPRFWSAMYAVGLGIEAVLPLLASLPAVALVLALGARSTVSSSASVMLIGAPAIAASFLVTYALLVAGLVRVASLLVPPGWHTDGGAAAWASWLIGGLMETATSGPLFPLFSSLYVRSWLRLLAVRVGERSEVSTAVGLSRLVSIGRTSFATDAVLLATTRRRGGWLHVAAISIGEQAFLGNCAIVKGGSRIGDETLVGVLTTAPLVASDGTSWLGAPPLELPRIPDRPDPTRTTHPPRRLVLARGIVELVRILLPLSASVALAAAIFWLLESVGRAYGLAAMIAAGPAAVLGAGIVAAATTVALKWLLMGRYRRGEHPLWSFFVWRDEVINSAQEQLAGAWILRAALGTPLVPAYLRAMGARVGRDVWCETLNITEFDLTSLGDGAVLNRGACVETHLFHDRLLRIGPSCLEAGSTLGPDSVVLPDTTVGAGTSIGARSVLLRGEELPANTRWHGSPVVLV